MCCLVCIFLLMFVSNHLSGAKRIHRRLQLLWTCLGGGDGYVRPWIPQSEVSGEKRHLRQNKTKTKKTPQITFTTWNKWQRSKFSFPLSFLSRVSRRSSASWLTTSPSWRTSLCCPAAQSSPATWSRRCTNCTRTSANVCSPAQGRLSTR